MKANLTYSNQPLSSVPRLLVPDHFDSDIVSFDQASPPEKKGMLTRLAPGVHMRYKTVADQDACVAMLCAAPDGTAGLVIDTDRYEHESQIYFELPKTFAYFAAAAPGSAIRINFQIVGQRLKFGESQKSSLSGLSLIERRGPTVDPMEHRILKKIPLQDAQAKTKRTLDIVRSPFEPESLELCFRVSAKSGIFSITMVSSQIYELLSSSSAKILPVGTRIQGSFPSAFSNCNLTVYSGGITTDVSIEDSNGFFILEAQDTLKFDINGSQLRSLLPSLKSSAAFVGLKLDGKLVAGAECELLSGPDDVPTHDEQVALQSNATILAAAESNFRNGRNHAGLTILDRLVDPDLDQKRTAVQLGVPAFVIERRFEEAIMLFEDLRPIDDTKAYTSYIEACVSGGYIEKAKDELASLILRTDNSSIKMLAQLYRFSYTLEDQHRSLFIERFLAVAHELRPFFKNILHLGHDLAARQDWRGFSQVVAVLGKFDLKGYEKANAALLMAQVAHQHGNTSQFMEQLNEALRRVQVAPISLVNADLGFSLSNVRAHSVDANRDGPLVSVLMTSFNSQGSIQYAITSVLEQSYRNLELIIVDDCSSDRTQAIINDLASADDRIVPIFAPHNSGTYPCKNLALGRARGEFITCHDSDDWAHPQRIETSVARLTSVRTLIATGTQVVRFSQKDGLQFRRNYIQPDAPSLMYRAEPVRQSLGYYDSVRAAGDTEFESRMKHAFGRRAVDRRQDLLTLASWSEKTLTGGGAFAINNDTGQLGRVRDEYRKAYGPWHERSDRLYLEFPLRERPFSAPEELFAAHSSFNRESDPRRSNVARTLASVNTHDIRLRSNRTTPSHTRRRLEFPLPTPSWRRNPEGARARVHLGNGTVLHRLRELWSALTKIGRLL